MARYRKKRPLGEVEALLYTGDNVEEIKEFLGENFMWLNKNEEDENDHLWFKPVATLDFEEYLTPLADMIVKYDEGNFGAVYEDDFLDEWERID